MQFTDMANMVLIMRTRAAEVDFDDSYRWYPWEKVSGNYLTGSRAHCCRCIDISSSKSGHLSQKSTNFMLISEEHRKVFPLSVRSVWEP